MRAKVLWWILAFCVATLRIGAATASDLGDASADLALLRSEAAGHRLILLGEKHGTREIPRFVLSLLTAYAEEGPVVLGLEIPRSEQPALDRYLKSRGDQNDRAALRGAPFWTIHGDQHDGRRSVDILDLIEGLRALRAAGRSVGVLAYDVPTGAGGDSQLRDRAMGELLREAFMQIPDTRLIVLAGNVHAMLDRPDDAPTEMQVPMGSYLRGLDPFSVNISARSGAFWACTRRCGPMRDHPGRDRSGRNDGTQYHLDIVLPRFTVARLLRSEGP